MKKYLLPQAGTFYKANLHCHSTLSDGSLSVEEIKRIYKEQGYSIVAFTDHDIFVPHPELRDEDFLPLNGFEVEINDESRDVDFSLKKTCHICFVALEEDTKVQPMWHRTAYRFGNAVHNGHLVTVDETQPDFERDYTPERISEMMRIGREKGFFVTYNHPTWSLESYPQYANYHGMHAMEIVNYGCIAAGYDDYNGREYDDMLRCGKRIYCIAADDNHNHAAPGTRDWDSFGGFIQIKAEKLEYRTITKALEAGNFYASQGPEIKELWYEDGKIHITCSDADRITLTTGIRRTGIVYGKDGGAVNEAAFDVKPDDMYVRITVTDKCGKHADTNAYFVNELL